MLKEVDSFKDVLDNLDNNKRENQKKKFFLSIEENNWSRIKEFIDSERDEYGASDYWAKRQNDFSYYYNKNIEVLLITGYFNSIFPVNPSFIPNKSPYKSLQEVFDQNIVKGKAIINGFTGDFGKKKYHKMINIFQEKYSNEVWAMYPTIASSIDAYEWFKVFEIISVIKKIGNGNSFKKMLEIGSGSCLLLNTLKKMSLIDSCIAVDLPFVIPFGFTLSSYVQGESNSLCLPNENDKNSWLIFQSNNRIKIKNNSVDLVINITSFGEMNKKQVNHYFSLINEALCPGGFFLCINREKKKVDFSDYPWPTQGYRTILEFEPMISRVGRNKMWRYPVIGKVIQKI